MTSFHLVFDNMSKKTNHMCKNINTISFNIIQCNIFGFWTFEVVIVDKMVNGTFRDQK